MGLFDGKPAKRAGIQDADDTFIMPARKAGKLSKFIRRVGFARQG